MGVLRHPTRLRSFREVVAFSCPLAAAATTTKKKGGERSLLYRTRSRTTTFPLKQKTNISSQARIFLNPFSTPVFFSLGRDDQTNTQFSRAKLLRILPHKKISAEKLVFLSSSSSSRCCCCCSCCSLVRDSLRLGETERVL